MFSHRQGPGPPDIHERFGAKAVTMLQNGTPPRAFIDFLAPVTRTMLIAFPRVDFFTTFFLRQ